LLCYIYELRIQQKFSKEAFPHLEEERRGLENCGPFKTTMEREVSKYRDRKEVSSGKPKIAIKIMKIILREHS
jgi:hypothetical protein